MEATPPKIESPVDLAGVGFTVGEGSEATFTVREQLSLLPLPSDAVLRTTALSGTLRLDGEPSVIEIDLHSLESDQSFRDRYVRTRMFPSDPIAIVTIEDVSSLLPASYASGTVIEREVAGSLSLLGAEYPVTFAIEARLDGEVLFVLARTSFTWDEYGIRTPNILNRVEVQDEVHVEVLLASRTSPVAASP